MEFSAADFEKLVMFEHARKACEAQYNLLQWGGALLEHAQFQPIPEAKLMLDGGGGGGGPAASSNASGGKKKNKRRRTMASLTMYVVGSLSLVGLLLGFIAKSLGPSPPAR
ncbi:hypothetical protein Bca4012_031271 [Brassica carinata]